MKSPDWALLNESSKSETNSVAFLSVLLASASSFVDGNCGLTLSP
jgi:hypothetical protein